MENEQKDASLMHDLDNAKPASSMISYKLIAILVVVAFLGVGTGFLLSKTGISAKVVSTDSIENASDVQAGKVYGSKEKKFKDTAEGILKEGGIEGEGVYHLERPGGPTQFVYLTSSVLDFSLFSGKKVKVWGETHTAEKAPWLIDVWQLEVLK